jgi:NAD(P)-dependent dehydrogenase (short-subunit alcohol dehydrogenase family)
LATYCHAGRLLLRVALAESFALEVAPLGIKVTAVEPGGMRTRFAQSSSLKVIESDPAYDETVGAAMAMMQSPEYGSYLGDPADHAALVLALAELEAPPVRILAGADAVIMGCRLPSNVPSRMSSGRCSGSLPAWGSPGQSMQDLAHV